MRSCGKRLPAQYSIEHVYHNFRDPGEAPEEKEFKNHLQSFYSGGPIAVLDFGRVRALNRPYIRSKCSASRVQVIDHDRS
jgi:hypothetical protein